MTVLAGLGRRGCECLGCGALFLGVPAFDAHRVGRHGHDRRCATTADMLGAGLAQDERGVWVWASEVGKPRPKPPIRSASPSGTPETQKTGNTSTAARTRARAAA